MYCGVSPRFSAQLTLPLRRTIDSPLKYASSDPSMDGSISEKSSSFHSRVSGLVVSSDDYARCAPVTMPGKGADCLL